MDNKVYLSWDVGITNLAYCLMYKNGNNFEIKKWGIINLGDEQKLCTCKLKNGLMCDHRAQYHADDGAQYYCAKHSKNYKPRIISTNRCTGKCGHLVNNTKACGR